MEAREREKIRRERECVNSIQNFAKFQTLKSEMHKCQTFKSQVHSEELFG